MKEICVKNILDYLDREKIEYTYTGEESFFIHSVCNLEEISDGCIFWLSDEKYYTDEVRKRVAGCKQILCVSSFSLEGINTILVDQPKHVFFPILNHFWKSEFVHEISPRAIVLSAKIGANVHISPGCYVGEEVEIGDNTVLHPNVTIEGPCVIGHDCEIYAGTVIGSDGFGYYRDMDGRYQRENHYRGVVIGNYVDIGANTCIDRGLLSDTTIKDNAKIDNLCHIAHNVVIGENAMVIACSTVCGSAEIARDAYVAPAGTVTDHARVGVGSRVGIGSLVLRDVADGETVVGVPGKKYEPKAKGL